MFVPESTADNHMVDLTCHCVYTPEITSKGSPQTKTEPTIMWNKSRFSPGENSFWDNSGMNIWGVWITPDRVTYENMWRQIVFVDVFSEQRSADTYEILSRVIIAIVASSNL